MANSATVGTAVIKLSFDGKKVKSELASVEKDAESTGGKIASSVGKVSKVVAASFATITAGAAALTGKIAKSAVESFADYEQLTGGVETLFKDSYSRVMSYANDAYKTAGLSANKYMEQATSFSASLLQGLGGDTEAAADYADKAITDMADNANKMGTSIEMIQNAYQGFAKQNYTMLDNLKLGYGGTAGEMARLINDSGVLGDSMTVTADTVNSVSFDKMIEAIHVVQDNLGITGTTAKEASSTIQGSFSSMQGAWQNLLVGIADPTQDFGVLIDNFVKSAGQFGKNILPAIQKALTGVANLVKELAPMIVEQLPGLVQDIVPPLLEAAIQVAQALIVALPQIIVVLVNAIVALLPKFVEAIVQAIPLFVEGVKTLLNALVQTIPTIIPQLVASIVTLIQTIATTLTDPEYLSLILDAAITLLLSLVDAIPDIIVALINAFPTVIDNIVAFLTNPSTIMRILQAAVKLFFALVQAVPQILGALLGAFGQLVGNLWNGITSMFGQFAANFGNFIGGIFKGAINGVLGFIEGFINAPIDLLNGFIGIINDNFGWIGVNIGYISRVRLPRLASGGVAMGATTAIIGEEGKEAVLPLENNTDNWAGLLASTLVDEMEEQNRSGFGDIIQYNTIEINNEMDAQDIGRVLMQSIRRAA